MGEAVTAWKCRTNGRVKNFLVNTSWKMFILGIQNKLEHNIRGIAEVRNENRPLLAACKMYEYLIDQPLGKNGKTDWCWEISETVFHVRSDYGPTTLTDQNSIQEEIKSRLKLGNACYYSVQNLLSSSLLSKNLKIKIYRTIILPVFLYGCETWSLTLRVECRLRVFENRVLRRVFAPKGAS